MVPGAPNASIRSETSPRRVITSISSPISLDESEVGQSIGPSVIPVAADFFVGEWCDAYFRTGRELHPALVIKKYYNGYFMLQFGANLIEDQVHIDSMFRRKKNSLDSGGSGADEVLTSSQASNSGAQTEIMQTLTSSEHDLGTQEHPFEEGDVVEAHVGGDEWIRGVILAVNRRDDTIAARFTNGRIHTAVPVQVLRSVYRWMARYASTTQEEDGGDDARPEGSEANWGGHTRPEPPLPSQPVLSDGGDHGGDAVCGAVEEGYGETDHKVTIADLNEIKDLIGQVLDSVKWEHMQSMLGKHVSEVNGILKGHHEQYHGKLQGHEKELKAHHEKVSKKLESMHGHGHHDTRPPMYAGGSANNNHHEPHHGSPNGHSHGHGSGHGSPGKSPPKSPGKKKSKEMWKKLLKHANDVRSQEREEHPSPLDYLSDKDPLMMATKARREQEESHTPHSPSPNQKNGQRTLKELSKPNVNPVMTDPQIAYATHSKSPKDTKDHRLKKLADAYGSSVQEVTAKSPRD